MTLTRMSAMAINVKHKILFVLAVLSPMQNCAAICSFPAKLLGEFVMQSTVTAGSQVQYSQVNITSESIPIWGSCYRRIENNVILMDISGGGNCFRCFHLNLRSKNVLQVRTEGLDKCYTKEDAALATCPGEYLISGGTSPERLKEILLYKTKDYGGEEIRKEYCPIDGHYTFRYNRNDGTENKPECSDFLSDLDNCPKSYALNLRFRRCSFENHDITFHCLGHWAGPGRQRYLALLDTRVGSENRAQYRCALYQEDNTTGNIYMAFSSDSTCTSDLRSATEGFETMILSPVISYLPSRVSDSTCRFPTWTQGHWQYIDIKDNTLVYKDHTMFETLTMKCVQPNIDAAEKFIIYRRKQCEYDRYTCIWIKKRALNVMEFQLGNFTSDHYNASLCADSNFLSDAWTTQGRTDIIKESPCPIAGEYTGEIPDNTGLCAKLYSDCNSPEVMFYTIANCSESQVYEGSRMRLPGRFPRWKRQVRYPQNQGRSRIYHISDPRLLLRTTPSSGTPSESVTIPARAHNQHYSTPSPMDEAWRDPYGDKFKHNPIRNDDQVSQNRRPIENIESVANNQRDSSLSQSFYSSNTNSSAQLPWFPRRDNTAEGSLAQFDNSGYTRRPVGYDASYNIPSLRYPSNPSFEPGKYVLESQYDMRQRQNPEYPYFARSAQQGSHAKQESQEIANPSSIPFSEEEYDPWAFSKIHGRKTQNTNYSQVHVPNWNSRLEPTYIPRIPVHTVYSSMQPLLVPPSPTSNNKHFSNPEATAPAVTRNISPTKKEERAYRCLGQWEENGLMYTYTQRKDVGSSFDFAHQFQFECFVGSISSNTEIYIQEAGEYCQRNVDSKVHQIMKLTKRSEGTCFGGQPTANTPQMPPPQPRPTSSWYSSKRPPEPTKPWKPITAPPRGKTASSAATCSHSMLGLLFIVMFLKLTV